MRDFQGALEVYREALAVGQAAARVQREYPMAVQRIAREIDCPLLDDPVPVRAALAKWRTGLQQRYEHGEISRSRIRNDVAVVRGFFALLVQRGLYPVDVAADIPSSKHEPWSPRPMPILHVGAILRAAEPMLPDGTLDPVRLRDRAMLEALYHGLRNSEVCTIATNRLASTGTRLHVTVIGKGSHERMVPFVPALSRWFGLHLLNKYAPDDWREWEEWFATTLTRRKEDPAGARWLAVERLLTKRLNGQELPVFEYTTDRWVDGIVGGALERATLPMRRVMLGQVFTAYRKAAGLEANYTPHRFRHTCCTEMLNKKVDIRVIQVLMGHKSLQTTMIYTQVADALKSEGLDVLPDPLAALDAQAKLDEPVKEVA